MGLALSLISLRDQLRDSMAASVMKNLSNNYNHEVACRDNNSHDSCDSEMKREI